MVNFLRAGAGWVRMRLQTKSMQQPQTKLRTNKMLWQRKTCHTLRAIKQDGRYVCRPMSAIAKTNPVSHCCLNITLLLASLHISHFCGTASFFCSLSLYIYAYIYIYLSLSFSLSLLSPVLSLYIYIYICCRVKNWSKIWAFIS